MNDMSSTIVAKSDQINAADLKGGPRTITISEVRIKAGDDQPVSVMIEGDKKAFRPCKGVRRLMVRVWGPDANKYIGQSMTIFCDPTVTWAGKEEGGIRVSHMTGLDERIVEFMRTSRAATKPYEILQLRAERKTDKVADGVTALIERIKACDPANLLSITDDPAVVKQRTWLAKNRPELAAEVDAVLDASRPVNEDDPFGLPEIDQEKRGDADMGESHTDPNPQHRKLADIMIGALRSATGDADKVGEIMDAQRDAMKEWPTALKQEVYDEQNIALGRGEA